MSNQHFIFDFDSTFIRVEALDVLCELAVENPAERAVTLAEVQRLTNLGMEGKLPLRESLQQRIGLLKANRTHIEQVIEALRSQVTDSVKRNRRFFEEHAANVYVISNGFKEIIAPIVAEYGIVADHVLANTFEFDEQGTITGFDQENPLCNNKGKAVKLQLVGLEGDIMVIGDGYTDYEMREAGVATRFYAFSENVSRPAVLEKADHIAPSLDEILYDLQYPASVSYPKNRIKVLLLENVHPDAAAIFTSEGYAVETVKGALSEEELCEKIKHINILGIRSKTQVTENVLNHTNNLLAIGTFCIGTNQVNLEACRQRGIGVFNAPYSNTRSVVELALGEMIMLVRSTFEKSNKLHRGEWDKSAEGSVEVRGKNLGIIGYGNIGAQFSVLAEALGMKVYFYDVIDKLALGNARKCSSLHELLEIADVVTLHVDGRTANQDLIGAAEFERMKNGVIFLNLSRGHVVELGALTAALKSGKVKGAAVDVFPEEPNSNAEKFISVLQGFENVILTPHVGGSTEEAQLDIGHFVANKIISYVNTGSSFGSVNLPEIQLPEFRNAHRIMHIHENVKGILAHINTILAEHDNNILGQYLKTNESIGYVITDVDNRHNKDLEKAMRAIPNTIRYRILY
ncbi:MAG: phosphoglycerate dehydrogenase [Bacteroidota bacterium]